MSDQLDKVLNNISVYLKTQEQQNPRITRSLEILEEEITDLKSIVLRLLNDKSPAKPKPKPAKKR
jgi:hypothetical protein